MPDVVMLDGASLSPEQVEAVAAGRRPVALADAAVTRMRAARHALLQAVADGRPVYGVTTGLGARVGDRLPAEAQEEASLRTVRGRANAVGPPLPAAVVRAAMTVRANGLAAGGSGADPAVAATLAAMLNADVVPRVPRTGSVCAGDLCLLAHVGLAMVGEGEVLDAGGGVRRAGAALVEAGLAPLRLGPRDGLAICSASAFSAGAGALARVRARAVLASATVAAALAMEGFRANPSPLDPRAVAARTAPGQAAAAATLRGLLAGGRLDAPGEARRLQDPLSFRCASQLLGSLGAALELLDAALAPELNGAADNPLVVAEDGAVLANGNFHTPALALALDAVALALAQAGAAAAARPARLASARLSDLPANLSSRGPSRSGVAPLLKVAAALAAELRHLAAPTCIGAGLDADEVEDDATGAALGALRLLDMLDRLERLVALELLVAAFAVDHAGPERLAPATAAAFGVVRGLVAPLDDDRPLGDDVERVAAHAVAAGRLAAAVDAALPAG